MNDEVEVDIGKWLLELEKEEDWYDRNTEQEEIDNE